MKQIYNAMKILMEINQKLFDICLQNYLKQKDFELEKQREKEIQWENIERAARIRSDENNSAFA